MRNRLTLLILGVAFGGALLLGGCTLPKDHEITPAPLAGSFSEAGAVAPPAQWWTAFSDNGLNAQIDATLDGNLDLQAAWDRLRRARAEAQLAGATGRLTADLGGGASWTRTVDRDQEAVAAISGFSEDRTVDRYFTNITLGYEFDLWGRIAATRDAADLRFGATRQDAEATALLLTGQVTDAWLTLLEQAALLTLIDAQIATNEQFVELTELRFSLGEGSALDVLQQRSQVARTRSERPPVVSAGESAAIQLDQLAGRVPDLTRWNRDALPELPALPPLPQIPDPATLFGGRPDLQAAFLRLEATDRDLAVAVADRLPRLNFSLSYELSADDLGDLFEQETGTLIGNIVGPLLDGGRRKAEVARREALLREAWHGFVAATLTVWGEIETLVAQDRAQTELLTRLEEELELTRSTVEESRSRYANGLDSYLSVLTALTQAQGLERRLISERRRLLSLRAQLYRALGGAEWTPLLEPAPEIPFEDMNSVAVERGDDPDQGANR